MEAFVQDIQVRWSDLDPNVHLRHSVYYDWAAYSRVSFLEKFGLNTAQMQELKIGPILFREECVFKREIRLNDPVRINLELLQARKDFSRWTIVHHVIKQEEILSAIVTVDGAWLDIVLRKLAEPPAIVNDVFAQMPRHTDFKWLD